MKKLCLTLAGIFFISLIFSACSSNKELTKIESKKTGSYVGQYDENMTPENSCVICIRMDRNDQGSVTFKQINPKMEADEQSFKYSKGDTIIFKPCKPGAKYMVTKAKGSRSYRYYNTTTYKWDFELKPNQQYYVVEAPKKPGLYTFSDNSLFILAFYLSEDYSKVKDIDESSNRVSFEQLWKIAADCYKNKVPLSLYKEEDREASVKKQIEEWGSYYYSVWDNLQRDYKRLNKLNEKFADFYAGTPWYDVFYEYAKEERKGLDKATIYLEDYKKNNHVSSCSLCD